MSNRLCFSVEARAAGSKARAARFRTLHNEVLTPLFMPVGTQATVRAQTPTSLLASGSQILLANTYHLILRPGTGVFKHLGGIHKFMNWPGAVLTDSGGYQIFSLPHSRSLTEEGAIFQSYIDGKSILLSPEASIEAQVAIGADIMMALDQCVASTAEESVARAAVDLTRRWAARSLAARGESPQALFGIAQGALFPSLRRESVLGLAELPFDGFAIGGLAVGEGSREREDICSLTAECMPDDKPRYLMGVGTPLDLLEAVHRGVDMFDCIIPTQVAQRGGAFTSRGFIQLRRGIHKFADLPLDPSCECPTCRDHSRAYLHHLTKAQETLGWQLIGLHNIHFYHQLMQKMRAQILAGNFVNFYNQTREWLGEDDLDNPVVTKPPKTIRHQVLGHYEIHTAREGFSSIRHVPSGEIMHSRTPPMEEAQDLYLEQSRLAQKLSGEDAPTASESDPLVLWDVGLGAASNAIAAIRCCEHLAGRGLHIVSFENDLDPLRLAFRNNHLFPELRHSGPPAILEQGFWKSPSLPGLQWTLAFGDFLNEISKAPAPPDLIFYDLFSGPTHASAWTYKTFQKLYSLCQGHPAELITYTCSTATRAAMLSAGFYVAQGRSAGQKSETTIALTPEAVRPHHQLLGAAWLAKWRRSSARFPVDFSSEEHPVREAGILSHAQFQLATDRYSTPPVSGQIHG